METLQTLLLALQVLCAVSLIGFILIQHGKGADAGAAFGSGASTTVFGAQGSGNFLTKTTTALAVVFLLNSLALAWIAKERSLEARQVSFAIDAEGPVSEGDGPAAGAAPDDANLAPGAAGSDVATEGESDVPTLPQ